MRAASSDRRAPPRRAASSFSRFSRRARFRSICAFRSAIRFSPATFSSVRACHSSFRRVRSARMTSRSAEGSCVTPKGCHVPERGGPDPLGLRRQSLALLDQPFLFAACGLQAVPGVLQRPARGIEPRPQRLQGRPGLLFPLAPLLRGGDDAGHRSQPRPDGVKLRTTPFQRAPPGRPRYRG